MWQFVSVSHAFNEKNDTFKIISTVATCFFILEVLSAALGEKENTEFGWKSISLPVLKNIESGLLSSVAKRGRNGLVELQKKYAPYVANWFGYFMFYQLLKYDRIIVNNEAVQMWRKWSCLERLIEAIEDCKISTRI